jgi:hypothetical protein
MVFSGLATKPVAMVFCGLPSKWVATVFSILISKPMATVSLDLTLKPVVSFLVEHQNQDGGEFPGLDLKTSSYSLVNCASKSLRWFFGLGLKNQQATVYRLCHKTNGRATAWDTRQDLAA